MNMRFIFLALSVVGAIWLVGCDQYRYPCQDPDNWGKKECKKPYCSTTGTCPEQLLKPEDMKADEPAKVNQPVPCPDAGAARCGN